MGTDSFSFEVISEIFSQSGTTKILSLDCFDTLFWRRVDKPHDIFSLINKDEGPASRAKAESKARARALFKGRTAEVSIFDIYKEMSKFFNSEEIEQRIHEEIDAEIKFGFIHQPALSLLKAAKDRGVRTIIVSDIYLSSTQLAYLIRMVSPETSLLIDKIYTSSDVGCGKTSGLWNYVVKEEKIKARDIFHVGDNFNADFKKPSEIGVNAFHYMQNEKTMMHIMEQRRIAASLLFSDYQHVKAIPSLFRSWYSSYARNNLTAEKILGCTVLGPALFGFCKHIKKQSEKHPSAKLAFLMRDGYMPKLAYEAMYPSETTYNLRISRLTSISSSFSCKKDIEDYLMKAFSPFLSENASLEGNDELINVTLKHLLVEEKTKYKIKSKLRSSGYYVHSLIDAIFSGEVLKEIIDNSLKYRKRLIMHIQKETGLKAGDTLMLIDLGYEGTTQNKLSDILEKELGIYIVGCYFIVSHTPDWERNRTGLISPRDYDWRIILSLTNHIASFELLCSSNDNSVVDYDLSGDPIYELNSISYSILEKISEIQIQAIKFIELNSKDVTQIFEDDSVLSESAVADIARFIYFPTIMETRFFESLTFEVNLGTKNKVNFLNVNKGMDYVKKYGISRLVDNGGGFRTNYPSELRYLGVDYAISLLSSYRNSIDFSVADSIQRRYEVDVLYVNETETFPQKIESRYTFDGFYSLYIPVLTTEIIIMLGHVDSMLEIMDFSVVENKYFFTKNEDNESRELVNNIDYLIDGGEFNKGIINWLRTDGFIYIKTMRKNDIIRLVYRTLSSGADYLNSRA
ncbi:xsa-associated protein [Pectobacterium atrosepticum ICMP 1526]|uniref:hypothetical protein n=1 Tax=Pectobacterium atrosepticum TaxID=29471 RepID=UPI0004FFF42B|nr:hypothetical protein [Pectobacterium atrosepticum]KFX17670.1 hypothetical protein JV34_01245 [Pectobacterium atrosepticum]KMK88685.1 xsa-associated protein [Pectobacterium atrosepticum ICMP 1526]QXE13942.1 hypothetical protein DCX48_05110 [Pectobacterium atrosepticum]